MEAAARAEVVASSPKIRKKPKPVLTLKRDSSQSSIDSPLLVSPDISGNFKGLALSVSDQEYERLKMFLKAKARFLQTEELRPKDFETLVMLGQGSGGSVSKVRHSKTGLILARKTIHLEVKEEVQQQIIRELKVLNECNSPDIVGFYGAFLSNGEINVLMEYMDGGSLDQLMQRIGRIPENVLRCITFRVLRGLLYLRDQKVIHRDIKPSNILVNTTGEVKLCDFGVSGELKNSLAMTFVGTRFYMAPERLIGNQYAVESDIWSLGLSLLELAMGRFPIPIEESLLDPVPFRKPTDPVPVVKKNTMSVFDLMGHIVDGEPPRLSADKGFSPHFQDFISRCLVKDPLKRSNLDVLQSHPWIKAIDTDPVDMGAWVTSTLMPDAPAE